MGGVRLCLTGTVKGTVHGVLRRRVVAIRGGGEDDVPFVVDLVEFGGLSIFVSYKKGDPPSKHLPRCRLSRAGRGAARG